MSVHSRSQLVRLVLLASALLGSLALLSSARAGPLLTTRDLPRSTTGQQKLVSLTAGTTYEASLLKPTPVFKPAVVGWRGTQFETHRHGGAAYQSIGLLWQGSSDRGILIVSGPAITLSPAATLAEPRARSANWNFTPYEPPGPVQHTTIAGRSAVYFDATAPPPGEWTILGKNPPEVRIVHDRSFRMEALRIHAQTVVIIIAAPAADFAQFLPIASRIVASLRFQSA